MHLNLQQELRGKSYNEKIEEMYRKIIILYCANKPNIVKQVCNNECDGGKCLCMDHEQLLLLEFLLGKSTFSIDLEGLLLRKATVDSDIYCGEQASPSKKKLINCHKFEMMHTGYTQEERNILETLPIIQYVNMHDEIDMRQTLACLFLFSEHGAYIFKTYLKAVVMRLCREYPNKGSIEMVGNATDRLFCQIATLYKSHFKAAKKTILQNFEHYSNSYFAHGMHFFVKEIREANDNFEEKAGHYGEHSDAFSWIIYKEPDIDHGLCYLYKIIDQILSSAGVTSNANMECFFQNHVPDSLIHDLYAEVEKKVNCLLKSTTSRERQVLCEEIDKLLDSEF